MGNVLLPDQSDARTAIALRVFEGSDPAELQADVQAFVTSLVGGAVGIYDMNLAGAGDGHAFSVTILTSTGVAAPLVGTQVSMFMGSSFYELGVQMNAAIAALVAQTRTITGIALDGSSLGNRVMGMFLHIPPQA